MDNITRKYALASILSFAISLALLVYLCVELGIFSNDKIIVTTIQSTGPDYEVLAGQCKLMNQMPDTVSNADANGIMVSGHTDQIMAAYLTGTDSFFDYYVLQVKVIGAKKSDSYFYHPLVEIISCKRIYFVVFWLLATLEVIFILLFVLTYRKYKKRISSRTTGSLEPL